MVGDRLDSEQDRLHVPQTLNDWVKKAERDSKHKPGLTSDMATRLKALEREILRKASAYFARAKLDRRHKP